MAAHDGHPQPGAQHLDNRPDSGSSDDPLWKQLIAAVEGGTPIVLGGGQLPEWTPEREDAPPPELVVVADVLRRVLVDRELASRADPRGLTIRGAVVVGELDLADSSVGYPLRLLGCRFTNSLTLDQAAVKTINVAGSHVAGVIRLLGAHVGGQLILRGATINGADDNGNSLVADSLQAASSVVLDEVTAAGAIRLNGAHTVGQLSLRAAKINGVDGDGYSLVADGLQADSDVYLSDGFTAVGATSLPGSHIGGLLSLRGAALGADADGISLVANHMQADSLVILDEGFTAAGAIQLVGAHIAGQITLRGAALGADADGNSLVADGLRADSDVFLVEGFTAAGAIRLPGARISGQLDMGGGAVLSGADKDGNSLVATSLQADSSVFLDKGFTAGGAIRLPGARISGLLILRGATINGADKDGRSLVGDGMQAASDVVLDEVTAAGAITLHGADIGHLVIGDSAESLPGLGDVTGWRIRDLHGVIRTNRKAAASWLETQEAAQPWQELAAVYDRNGQPADARWMRYRSAVHSTGSTSGAAWLGRQAYRWTTGHGYYPLAALGWLVVIFGVAWSLTAVWADEFTTATTNTIREDLTARAEAAETGGHAEDPPIPDPLPGRAPAAWCTDGWDVPCLNPPVYALTTAFPAAAGTQPWAPPAEGWGPAVVFYVLRLLAWVFTALLLAGVTGLLRKQT